jgi:low affinity Fe/Cu permease
MNMSENFSSFTRYISFFTGKPRAFLIAFGIIIVWLLTGPFFDYSDTWQLVINTGTSLVTFLMVFMIQNTQNRESAAVQIKLDELIRAHVGAHNILLDLEELTQEQIDAIRQKYENLAKEARADLKLGKVDTDSTTI